MPDGSTVISTAGASILDRMPPHVLAGFTAEQRAAISAAARESVASARSVNLRLSIPFLFRRVYLTILAGPERRGDERRKSDRGAHPLRTAGNFMFVIAAAAGFYVTAAVAILIYSSILEF